MDNSCSEFTYKQIKEKKSSILIINGQADLEIFRARDEFYELSKIGTFYNFIKIKLDKSSFDVKYFSMDNIVVRLIFLQNY